MAVGSPHSRSESRRLNLEKKENSLFLDQETSLTAYQATSFCKDINADREIQECVIALDQETSLTAYQATSFCEDINADREIQQCVIDMDQKTSLTAYQATSKCQGKESKGLSIRTNVLSVDGILFKIF